MRNGKFRRVLAAALAAVMICSMPVNAAAVGTHEKHVSTPTASAEQFGQFTGTADLIAQVATELYNEGKIYVAEQADKALVEQVENSSDYSFEAAQNLLADAFFNNRENGTSGEFDTTRLNLSREAMEALVESTLKAKYLKGIIEVDYEEENGIVTSLKFSMRDSFAMGLDEIAATGNEQAAEEAAVENAETEQAATFAVQRSANTYALSTAAEEAETCAHQAEDEESIDWSWIRMNQYYFDEEGNSATDENGNDLYFMIENNGAYYVGDMSTGDVLLDPVMGTPVPAYSLYYDQENGEIFADRTIQQVVWYCTNVVFTCVECGEEVNVEPENGYLVVDEEVLATNPELYMDYGSLFFVATAYDYSYAINATKTLLNESWALMCTFNADHGQYFGAPAPYWTTKNTENTPMDAVKWLCNMQEEDFIPDMYMNSMTSMLTQAFMSYVMQYGGMLDAMMADAMACFTDDMTTIQKYLMLHDWLAKYATFDMQSLVDQVSGESSGSDPITMTAFGTLLADQLGVDYNGGVCLGYAATYALLLQTAFLPNNQGYDYFLENPMVDFGQIKYMTDVAESSVASGDSGFGQGMFNSPHFFNVVKNGENWYYVDACYDDISTEVISQYRVETDGNIYHGNFMLAPTTWEEMYEGNFQFIDSLYDGVQWVREWNWNNPDIPEMGGYYSKVYADGTKLTDEEAKDTPVDNKTIYYLYNRVETDSETEYSDDTYETAWFASAVSEIVYNDGNFYYVEGQMNSYASMKDMMEDEEDGENSGNDFMDDMSIEDMLSYKNNPDTSDELRVRPVGKTDVPTQSSQFGQSVDEHSTVIFHYGYGKYGQDAEDASNAGENSDFSQGDDNGVTDEEKGPYYQQILEDTEYRNAYPDVVHSLAIHDGKIYFNLGAKIFTYDLSVTDGDPIKQLKEYNKVTYGSNGERFTGMSFATDAGSSNSLVYHPIAALCIKDQITWDEDQNRSVEPTMYVSIATNLSNSCKDSNDEAYKVEAINYNADYYRFMDEDKGDGENTNTEFMWCANVVDKMVIDTMLSDNATQTVSVDAYCGHASFTETRSQTYGLSDGSTKKPADDAVMHNYVYNEDEDTLICSKCDKAHEHVKGEPTVAWTVPEDVYSTTATATITCEDEFCPLNNETFEGKVEVTEVTVEESTPAVAAETDDSNPDDGNTDDNGENDNTGDNGENDNTGDNGENDNTGDNGENNNTGDNGENDNTGDNGENDNTGDNGENDNTGDNGENDNTGDNGENDNTGDNGENDNTGDDNTDPEPVYIITATFEIDNVTYVFQKGIHDDTQCTWSEGTVNTEPTCCTEGETSYTCTIEGCPATKTEVTAATKEHTWPEEGKVTTQPNCVETGVMTYTCSVSGCGATKTESVEATHEHEWTSEVTTEPTCSTTGVRTYTCTTETETIDNCPVQKSEVIETLPHTYDDEFVCTECGALKPIPFTDVAEDNWARKAVGYVYHSGLMVGTSETLFQPNAEMTRAMVVRVLYCMAGEPESTASNPFSDIADGKWYTEEVIWAAEQGVVAGYEDGTFRPDQKVNRQELVAMVHRYAVKFDGAETTGDVNLEEQFSDADTISKWAVDDVKWAVANGIINGFNDGTVKPFATATRAQCAQILYTYLAD